MNKDNYPLILQMKTICQILGLSKSKVYEIAREPDFPVITIGNRKIVYRDDFFIWLDSKKRAS